MQKARNYFRKAFDLDPDLLDAKINLAYSYLELKDYNQVIKLFSEVDERYPNNG